MLTASPDEWVSCYESLCHTPLESASEELFASDHPVSQFQAYWNKLQAETAMPPRSALQPVEIKSLLKWIMLLQVSSSGSAACMIVRLHGTAAAAMMHHDFTGLDLRDFTAEENFVSRRDAILACIERAWPQFGRSRVQAAEGPTIEIGVGLFPFQADDGEDYHVAMIGAPQEAALRRWL